MGETRRKEPSPVMGRTSQTDPLPTFGSAHKNRGADPFPRNGEFPAHPRLRPVAYAVAIRWRCRQGPQYLARTLFVAGWSKYPHNNLDLDDSWPHAVPLSVAG
jgi:hypothetical protein